MGGRLDNYATPSRACPLYWWALSPELGVLHRDAPIPIALTGRREGYSVVPMSDHRISCVRLREGWDVKQF